MAKRNTHLHAAPAQSSSAPSGQIHCGKAISLLRVDAYEHGGIVVTSSAVDSDGRLDPIHSAAGDGTFPPIAWTGILEAESYVLVVEDPDAPRDEPMIHWVVWDIPRR